MPHGDGVLISSGVMGFITFLPVRFYIDFGKIMERKISKKN